MTVMTEHPNLLRLHQGFEAFAKGDFDAFRELFVPDVVWATPYGFGTFKTEYRGLEETLGYFGELFAQSDGTIKVTEEHSFADDTVGMVIAHVVGDRKGQHLDQKIVMVFEFLGDKTAKVTWYTAYPDVFTEFWG